MRPETQPFPSLESPHDPRRASPTTRFASTLELDRVLDVISTVSARIELEGGARRAA